MKKELIDSNWIRFQCEACGDVAVDFKPCVLFVPEDCEKPNKCPYGNKANECLSDKSEWIEME